jgi:mRNA degradation ribonuclease J1/J2
MQRLIEWLNFYGMPLYHIHVSGHIMPQDLKGLVAKIRAKYTSPIHTEHPELFSKFMKNKDRITIPKPNQSIDI